MADKPAPPTALPAATPRPREPRGDVLIHATPVGFDATAEPVQAGPCRLFIGTRSDPFFADADGVLHWLIDGQQGNFQWTGTDTFAGANILSIAVEAPNDMLGPGPSIGAWITTSLRRDGALVPMDREGNPSFNPILNADDIKDQFNATDPVDDVENYLQPLAGTLQRHGYPPGRSRRRRPHAATRHPALRPHQAGSLPQWPGHDRRRLLRPHDLHGPRAGHPPARQATRRPAGPLPLPRPAQPLTAESGRRRRAPLVTAPADVIGIILDAATTTWPGPADEIQLDLFLDYASNIELYPKFQDYFRTRQPPLLAIWGRNDPFFLPAGAEAVKRDIPAADVRLLDTGHFALETHADEIATAIRTFLTDQQL